MKSKEKVWETSVIETSFSKDESACAPTLLKTVSTTDILIDQVHKFQNSDLKERLWKLLLFYKKHIVWGEFLRACYEIRS